MAQYLAQHQTVHPDDLGHHICHHTPDFYVVMAIWIL
jgi:hypothetical protein